MKSKKSWNLVNITFVKKEKEAIRDMGSTSEEFEEAVRAFALGGYKVGISFDQGGDVYALAITGKADTGPDENSTFMAFHSSFDLIRSITVYLARQCNDNHGLRRLYDIKADTAW